MPARITQLAIGAVRYRDIEALAHDMSKLSTQYGRKLDGVLGYSFLVDKAVLVDYPAGRVSIGADAKDVLPAAANAVPGTSSRCAFSATTARP